MSETHDVAAIGGGPRGSTAGHLLARAGRRAMRHSPGLPWRSILPLALLWAPAGAGTVVSPSPEDLLRAADASRYAIDEGVIRIRSTVEKPDAEPVVSDLDVYVQGADRALCVFRAGPFAGRRILMAGDRVWLLVPGTSRPIPISASQRLLGGASIGDVARLRFAAEFTGSLRPQEETIEGIPCRVIDLAARGRGASYAGGVLWLGAADGLPREASFTLSSGKEAKRVRYAAYATERGRPILKRMEIRHRLASEGGMRTTLEFSGYEKRTLDPGIFDPVRARDLP